MLIMKFYAFFIFIKKNKKYFLIRRTIFTDKYDYFYNMEPV